MKMVIRQAIKPQHNFSTFFYYGKRFCSTRSVLPQNRKGSQSVAGSENLDSALENESQNILRVLKSQKQKKSLDIKEKTVKQTKSTPRKNELNIQMISENLYQQIFGKNIQKQALPTETINRAIKQLKDYGLWDQGNEMLPEVYLNIPDLQGNNIEEHFWNIGEEQSRPYKNLIGALILKGIPKPPEKWLCEKGWTKYEEGQLPKKVSHPEEDALIFDVEVCVKLGDLPTLATAVSEKAWYGWICSDLSEGLDPPPTKFYYPHLLIPIEDLKKENCNRPRIIVGHSVSYDRLRIEEQYYLTNSGLRFIDTMALHISIGGASSSQKSILKSQPSSLNTPISKVCCLSSLRDLYKLYCGKDLEKESRTIFLEKTLPSIRNDFQNLMTYCAYDVVATFEVLQVIFPIFLERFPHPVTMAGMLEMGSGYLPVTTNWKKFLTEADQTYEDLKNEMNLTLSRKSDVACQLFHNKRYEQDLWMWDEDWSTQELKFRKKNVPQNWDYSRHELSLMDDEEKQLAEKFKDLFANGEKLHKCKPFLPGYPSWYRKLFEKSDWTVRLSTSRIISPKLLQLTWENFPLHHIYELGWGILVADIYAENVKTSIPFEKLKQLTIKNCKIEEGTLRLRKSLPKNTPLPYYKGSGIWCNHKVDDCCYFYKLPHKDGSDKNVGNPLSKDFIQIFSSNLLSSSDSAAEKVMNLGMKFTYWRNNRDRILNQMVVWFNEKSENSDQKYQRGVILPKTVVCGTLTRRALEPTWLTASKTTESRIGSELRSMVEAPPGYHLIGADVDSEELWIASLLGDSHYLKIHGCTPLGWMTISGSKANGTDMHSVTAKQSGITRSEAKIINYARIYGAGVTFAAKLLLKFNPSMSSSEAEEKAKLMFQMTKGKREFVVRQKMMEIFHSKYGAMKVKDWHQAFRIANELNCKVKEVFESCVWKGGTESATFNQLENIARSKAPVTPFLSSRLTAALESGLIRGNYLNTRINWVVQSGAVDFLHLMLVCMRWLTKGRARYCFSFHDEVRYLIPSHERYNGALALQITNLLVRSFCSYRLKMYDLPLSVAFFSSVEVDKVMRKEAHDDCITPSNPYGLEKGYGIPKGESINIYEIIEKSGGTLEPFSTNQGELEFPSEGQQIVQVVGSRGNNLHEVQAPDSTNYLVSMPTKFRKNVWIKKGDYILVEPINEGDKVKGEMVKVLTADYVKFLKKENKWPVEFSEDGQTENLNDDTFFVNNNHSVITKSDSSGESSE